MPKKIVFQILLTLLLLILVAVYFINVRARPAVNDADISRCSLARAKELCRFTAGFAGFTVGGPAVGIGVVDTGDVCCLQVSSDFQPANRWRTVRKRFDEPQDFSDSPLFVFSFWCAGEAPTNDYLLRVKLGGSGEIYEKEYPVVPDCWNEISFDMRSCGFIGEVDYVEIGLMNDSFEKWSSVYRIAALQVGCPYNLTFDVPGTASLFSVKRGSAKQTDGKLCFSFGHKSLLTSPEFAGSRHGIFQPDLQERNTFCFVMENRSSARSVRVSFITNEDRLYDESKSKVFPLIPRSPEMLYYFNFSDCPAARGRMLGFRISPLDGMGNLLINSVSFEEEAPIETLIGAIIRCEAKDSLVTVSGKLLSVEPETGDSICLYGTSMAQKTDDPAVMALLGKYPAEKQFTFSDISLKRGVVSLLSSQFLAVLQLKNGEIKKIAPRFYIDNWRDFEDNPYAFRLPSNVVYVTDYDARGDGFTDDTKAIQTAIDWVALQGGGQVVIPGDNSVYGRRYVVTGLQLRSNVDLHISPGAVLWQSQNVSDYAYRPTFGHDAVMPDVNWAHCLHVSNWPLILGSRIENVKITGGGKIRMADPVSENEWSDGYSRFCSDRIHLIPIGFWEVKNIEISNIDIVRSNNYHLSFYGCQNLFVGNVKLHEVKCVSGDGFGLGLGTHNVKIVRSFLQSNDDGVTLWCCYDDPRGVLWWNSRPGKDNSVYNVTVCHSYLHSGGGKAIAFIPWGTNDPNPEKQQIYGINVYDNVLQGGYSVGAWPDNPYGGKQPFDNSEMDDFSPVKEVRIHDNLYLGESNLLCIRPSNVVSDCGIRSVSDFVNADFGQGTAYWTTSGVAGVDSGVGYVNKGMLCQGLYLTKGRYTLSADVNLSGSLFVDLADAGQEIKSVPFSSDRWKTQQLPFTVSKDSTYLLGIVGDSAQIRRIALRAIP